MQNFFWEMKGVQGFVLMDILPNNLTVTEKSIVVASVSEVNIPQGSTVGSANNDPFLGAANHIAIQNIVPLRNGHILVAIETNWTNGPINLRVSGSVLGEIA
jgi:hypothetical protein